MAFVRRVIKRLTYLLTYLICRRFGVSPFCLVAVLTLPVLKILCAVST